MERPISKRVIITGASSGIGAALARSYAARGAVLGLIARRETELNQLAAQLGGNCTVYALDVRDAEGLRRAASGRVDPEERRRMDYRRHLDEITDDEDDERPRATARVKELPAEHPDHRLRPSIQRWAETQRKERMKGL